MRQCRAEGLAAVLPPAGLGLRGSRAALPSVRPGSVRPHASLSLFCMKFQWEKMDFVSLLLLIFPAVAVSRAQVQQEPSAETSEGTGINITCSHPNVIKHRMTTVCKQKGREGGRPELFSPSLSGH